MTAETTKFLIVGATGYMCVFVQITVLPINLFRIVNREYMAANLGVLSGGSILAEILQSPGFANLCVSALIRRPGQATALKTLGVKPIQFKGLDDLDACRDAASHHDGMELPSSFIERPLTPLI